MTHASKAVVLELIGVHSVTTKIHLFVLCCHNFAVGGDQFGWGTVVVLTLPQRRTRLRIVFESSPVRPDPEQPRTSHGVVVLVLLLQIEATTIDLVQAPCRQRSEALPPMLRRTEPNR